MAGGSKPSVLLKYYVGLVVAGGTSVIAASAYELAAQPPSPQWLILAALTLLSGSITVRIPSVSATLSVSEAFVFTSVLLFRTPAGTITAALDGLIISLWLRRKGQPFYRVLFNMAATAASLWVAGTVLEELRPSEALTLQNILLPITVFTILYFCSNTWLIAIAIGLEQRVSAMRVWRDSFLWLSLNSFSGASVAALLAVYTREVQLTALWIFVPILVITYLTYKTALGRVDDANRHLVQLNALHLSTIETLAMAIDAKDQITHGHIRRVQDHAVRLAARLGVKEERQIRAIEAASLLHDMGKLAVPDYILNKPGPLTPAEYEKMKLHSSVGADILSSIEFPYPVVPIVRHHHENWDGSGYPDGLRSSDIPIGARILAVVDCYDALTSDRPYRPRLSDSAALHVIAKRRGTMYDPVVVDAFMAVHDELARTEPQARSQSALAAIAEAASPAVANRSAAPARLEEISASSEEMLALFEISRGLAGAVNIEAAGAVIARHLRRVVPAAFCVFYVYDEAADDLVAAYAAGDKSGIFSGLRIPLGQRLTGWVAANRQTIVNSDPTLDLGEAARVAEPPLRSSLATPLIAGDSLVGVLTLYSPARNAYTDDHRRIVEAVARQVSLTIRSARDFDRAKTPSLRDAVAGLPTVERLRLLVAPASDPEGRLEAPCSVLFIGVDGLQEVNARLGRAASDRVLSRIVDLTRQTLRGADLLCCYRSDEFVGFLGQTEFQTAKQVALRVQIAIRDSELGPGGEGLAISVRTGVSSAPQDGLSLDALLAAARRRAAQGGEALDNLATAPKFIH